MNWIYVIGKILTFPGSFMKGFWEHIACRMTRLAIEQPAYLNADENCGHVEHSWTQKRSQQITVCLLPAFFNLLFGLPLFCAGFLQMLYFGVLPGENITLFLLMLSMLYLGVSLLCNLAPLREDALHLWDLLYHKPAKRNKGLLVISKILLFFPALFLRFCAFLEQYAINVLLFLLLLTAGFLWL